MIPITFDHQAPPLGALLMARGPNDYDYKPGCSWRPTVEEVQRTLGWGEIRDLVCYVTPTTLGQDLFVFYNRDRAAMSFKPHPGRPSTLCQEAIRHVCSGLSSRIADWAHSRQQILFQHVFGHTVKTPIEISRTALKNLLAEKEIQLEGSARSLVAAIEEVSERVGLALEVIDTFRDPDEPALQEVDILDQIRRLARTYKDRYRIDWQLYARNHTSWPIMMANRRLVLLLSNALGNAFKYSYRDYDVIIHVSDDKAAPDPAHADTIVRIQNFGFGVTRNELPRLASLQYRGDAVVNTQGSGLGLFLIDWIMKREGKRWKFYSTLSEGLYSESGEVFKNRLTLRLPGRLNR